MRRMSAMTKIANHESVRNLTQQRDPQRSALHTAHCNALYAGWPLGVAKSTSSAVAMPLVRPG